jgi:hypothetical protein
MGLCQGYGSRVLLGFSLYKLWSMLMRCSFLTMHFFLSFIFCLCILTIATFKLRWLILSSCLISVTYTLLWRWRDRLNEEDQVHIDISCLLLVCLCFTPRVLHFALLYVLSFITYSFTSFVHPMFLCMCSLLEREKN